MCRSGKTNKPEYTLPFWKRPRGILCELISGWQFLLSISSQNKMKITAIKLNQSKLFKKWNILKCVLQNSQYFTYSNWSKGANVFPLKKHTLLHNLTGKEKGYSHRRPEEALHPILLTEPLNFSMDSYPYSTPSCCKENLLNKRSRTQTPS